MIFFSLKFSAASFADRISSHFPRSIFFSLELLLCHFFFFETHRFFHSKKCQINCFISKEIKTWILQKNNFCIDFFFIEIRSCRFWWSNFFPFSKIDLFSLEFLFCYFFFETHIPARAYIVITYLYTVHHDKYLYT